MSIIQDLLRPHIHQLIPYSSARDEYSSAEGIFLDANENPIGSVTPLAYNRYPDPYQRVLKEKLAQLKSVQPENIFLGNGSDEVIDLLIRAFCEPHSENIIVMPPTYGMYEVSANINAVSVIRVPLTENFQIDLKAFWEAITPKTKIVFLCSPNNPSGNLLQKESIREILENFSGITLIDEAYIDFCPEASWLKALQQYPRMVIIQTFSKAWGLAALRLGMAFAHPDIIAVFNKIKPPYNINKFTQDLALKSLYAEPTKNQMVQEILQQRAFLAQELSQLPFVEKVFPSDANFLLVKMQKAQEIFEYLLAHKVIVRNRTKVVANCLRISIGTKVENQILLEKLRDFALKFY